MRRTSVLGSLAVLAVVRRLHDVTSMGSWRAWDRQRRDLIATAPGNDDRISVVVPLYEETEIVEATLAFWSAAVEAVPGLDVLLLTTEKEGTAAGSTHHLLQQADPTTFPPGLRVLHCPHVHRYRAAQIDVAIEAVRDGCARRGGDPSHHWIAIYNADSRPELATFTELRVLARRDRTTRAYQQLVDYFVSNERPASPWMEPFAVAQSWWIHARWFRETRRALVPRSTRRRTPLTTFGHGELLRLDLMTELGSFPAYAYADGLLLGWELRATGEQLGIVASHDWAEVPRRLSDLVVQHRAWFRGMLTLPEALHDRPDRRTIVLDRQERRALRVAHGVRTILWGGRPVVAVASMALVLSSWKGHRRTALLAAIGLAANPLVPAVLAPWCWRPMGAERPAFVRAPSRARLLAFSPLVPFVDGVGFWWALRDALDDPKAPPPKTPR
jgi:hypothetical protein